MRESAKDKPTLVYVATNVLNKKRYVGITCGYLSRRKAAHLKAAKNGATTIFAKAIRKYGMRSINFAVVATFSTYEEAQREEIRLILEMRPEYNCTAGGDGAMGYKHTAENILKMSERNKGRPGFWKGKELPAQFREGTRRYQLSRTDNERVLALGPKSIQRPVVCLDDGRVFESVRAAGAAYGIGESSISTVCRKSMKRRTAGGRVFRFAGEEHGGAEEAERIREEVRKSQFAKLVPSYRKAVIRLNDLIVFDTVKEAAVASGLHMGTIIMACKGRHRRGTFSGMRFNYLNEWCPNAA